MGSRGRNLSEERGVEGRVNGKASKGRPTSFRDAVMHNIEWPSSQGSRLKESRGMKVISFHEGELENRLHRLKCCLVGRILGEKPPAFALGEWAKKVWRMGGELQVRRLPKGLFLFFFPFDAEATRILKEGVHCWQGGKLLLDVCHPTAGCRWNERRAEGDRVVVSELPVHLWGRKTFETIGELCGGLIDFKIQDPGSME